MGIDIKTFGLICIFVLTILLGSCYKYDNPLDPGNPDNMTPTPTFNPPGGTYTSQQSVSMYCALGGADIRYTTNGSEPTETSNLYSSPISVAYTNTIKAKAFKTGYNPSQTSTSIYTINLPSVATPTFNPPGGTYSSAQSVSMYCALGGADIRYTTNGSEPTETSSLYSSPVSITNTTTLKAKAFKTGYSPSTIATAIYSIVSPPITVLYPNGGEVFHRGQTYTITWLPGPNTTPVDVQVFKGTTLWLTIQNYATNDGSISWTVSNGIQIGNDYRIKVRNSDYINHTDDFDFSDSYFSIE